MMDEKFDEPIYLLSSSMNCCYVIEDKRHDNQNQIAVYTDVFRSLRLPYLSLPALDKHLVVFNSCFYMLASALGHKGRSIPVPKNDLVRFCDLLHLSNPWQIGPSFPSPQRLIQVATSNNGSIVARGSYFRGKQCVIWLESLTSSWVELPEPPKSLNVEFNSSQILALTATHIFLTAYSTSEQQFKYGLRFSLVKKEWEVFDKRSFNGTYSQGVVLYDSYLVLYGTIALDIYEEKGFLRVYDLEKCSWLVMEPTVATDVCEKVFPPNFAYITSTKLPILFQVAQNKLAVVWQDRLYDYTSFSAGRRHPDPQPYFVVYCTKFILHKTSETYPRPTRVRRKTTPTHAKKTTGTKQPSFYFEFVSHRIYPIDEAIISPSVRVTLADEGRTGKEQMSRMSYHEEKEEDGKLPIIA